MAIKTGIFVLLTIAFLMPNSATSARDFPVADNPTILDLATRLQATSNGTTTTTTSDCWSSLSELRTCSNEIIGFFLNGYTDIDEPCCQAIEVIIHHCWPSMLSVLGFTVEEGNLLAAYCNKFSAAAPVGAPPETETTASSHF
ncbi:hypothetical protein BVRB_8g182930 [Beta vulgaris subsp. vulgaris]|nr:hypothetical protein BVRB_8g182930 [Beta vulgaris subsp. vulgaris]